MGHISPLGDAVRCIDSKERHARRPYQLRVSRLSCSAKGGMLLLAVVIGLSAAARASTLHADVMADAERSSSRMMLQEGETVLSREVQMACKGLSSETEFELLKESISRFAIALFLFLLMLTFGFAYMLHRTHFTCGRSLARFVLRRSTIPERH